MTRESNGSWGWALLGLAVPLLAGCTKTHVVRRATELSEPNALYYVLPLTVLKVTSTVSISTLSTAVCSTEAASLGIEQPVLTPPCAVAGAGPSCERAKAGKYFTLHGIEVEGMSEADPGARFAVDLTSTGGSQLSVSFDPRGVMTKAQSDVTDEIFPAAFGIAKAAVGIGLNVFGSGSLPPDKREAKKTYCNQAKSYLGTIREAITELYGSGSAGDSKDVLELKFAKLSVLEKKAESLFNGVVPGTPKQIVCEVRLERPALAGTVKLFDYSGALGGPPSPLPATSPAAPAAKVRCEVPAGLAIESTAQVDGTKAALEKLQKRYEVVLSIKPIEGVLSASKPMAQPATDAERSFYYRVPRFADVFAGERTPGTLEPFRLESAKQRLAIAQLGEVRSLPVLEVGGSATLSVALDPVSGALLELTAKEKGMDLGAHAGTVGDMITGAISTNRDAELKDLQRKQALLEAQVAIEAAQKALSE